MKIPPFDSERREMFALRVAIGQQINYLRGRYGNKDCRAPDGSCRRYENPMFARIEENLHAACADIFIAEKEIFTLPQPASTSETEE